MSFLQNLGQWADIIGTKLNLPEVHASERLAGGNTLNTVNYQYAHGNNPFSWTSPAYVPTYTNAPQGQRLNQNFVNNQSQTVSSKDMFKYGGVNNVPSQSSQPQRDYRSNQPRGSYTPNKKIVVNGNRGYYNDNGDWVSMGSGQPQGPSQADVDSAYAEAMGIFNQMQQNAMGGEQSFYDQYSQPYEAQKPLLEEAKRRGLQTNQTQQDLNRKQEQNALAAARRLYSELNQGVRQRYGGVNSAGNFAQTFYGRELMRQKGNVMNTAGQNMQKLLDKKASIEQGYQAQLQSLEQQKQAALLQAKDAFRQRIDAINNAKAGMAQNKAAMKLQLLRDYRQQQQTIQNAVLQHKMQLDSMVQQANLSLRNSILGYQTQSGNPPNLQALQSQFSAPTIGGGTAQESVDPTGYLAYMNNKRRKEQSMYQNY